ncbi:hypothetical protein EV421DRAFT_2037573 [Armillaria borealis]|uniref:NAD(P)-binding protein n=1 Tax=Armillaria borealis TaxID=47425 RepID=A0AA39JA41_9AGAR|nr:hypothetical protein EV421DRAFT_2037573 [Armillaria borealis]
MVTRNLYPNAGSLPSHLRFLVFPSIRVLEPLGCGILEERLHREEVLSDGSFRTLALNTIAPFFVVRAFQSLLIKGARSRPQCTSSVINVSSVGAQMNTSTPLSSVANLMTKSALDKLTLVLGTSFAQRGNSPEVLEAIKTKPLPGMVAPIPAKRQGTEVEMGMTAVYLAVSDYMNGAVLTVDGAVSLVNP